MKIFLIPDKFKGSLSASEVIAALAKGIKRAAPNALVYATIASDGGDGFLDAVKSSRSLQEILSPSCDPLGEPLTTPYLLDPEKKTAYVELAQSSGMVLLEESQRNPMRTSTLGTGMQIRHAIAQGAKTIYVGLGGSATNDGGTGIAHALGYRFLDPDGKVLEPTGGNLIRIASIRTEDVLPALGSVAVYAVNDVNNPLAGPDGAAWVYGRQKGASDQDIATLDRGLTSLAEVAQKQLGVNYTAIPGSGAAGGAAFGLKTFLGASFIKGIDFMLRLSNLEAIFTKGAVDLIITGEGAIDAQTLNGKVIHGVLQLGKKYQTPVVAICGQLSLEKSSCREQGLAEVIEIRDPNKPIAYSMENAASLIEEAIFQFMRTFSS